MDPPRALQGQGAVGKARLGLGVPGAFRAWGAWPPSGTAGDPRPRAPPAPKAGGPSERCRGGRTREAGGATLASRRRALTASIPLSPLPRGRRHPRVRSQGGTQGPPDAFPAITGHGRRPIHRVDLRSHCVGERPKDRLLGCTAHARSPDPLAGRRAPSPRRRRAGGPRRRRGGEVKPPPSPSPRPAGGGRGQAVGQDPSSPPLPPMDAGPFAVSKAQGAGRHACLPVPSRMPRGPRGPRAPRREPFPSGPRPVRPPGRRRGRGPRPAFPRPTVPAHRGDGMGRGKGGPRWEGPRRGEPTRESRPASRRPPLPPGRRPGGGGGTPAPRRRRGNPGDPCPRSRPDGRGPPAREVDPRSTGRDGGLRPGCPVPRCRCVPSPASRPGWAPRPPSRRALTRPTGGGRGRPTARPGSPRGEPRRGARLRGVGRFGAGPWECGRGRGPQGAPVPARGPEHPWPPARGRGGAVRRPEAPPSCRVPRRGVRRRMPNRVAAGPAATRPRPQDPGGIP